MLFFVLKSHSPWKPRDALCFSRTNFGTSNSAMQQWPLLVLSEEIHLETDKRTKRAPSSKNIFLRTMFRAWARQMMKLHAKQQRKKSSARLVSPNHNSQLKRTKLGKRERSRFRDPHSGRYAFRHLYLFQSSTSFLDSESH